MPLHDWSQLSGWEGVHHLWMTELLRWIKPRLPEGYRAYIGTAPMVAIGAPIGKPNIGVRRWEGEAPGVSAAAEFEAEAPDEELAVAMLDPTHSLFVEQHGRLVAAVELISPRNKDRVASRSSYLARYAGYLLQGIHLLLVDVHPRPLGFSFADQIDEQLQMERKERAALPPPFAISYRVGEPAASGGRFLAIWRKPLGIGSPLPSIPLALSVERSLAIELESTYAAAAADAYLID